MYTAKRWPDGRIPYIMENKFASEERAAIARGIMILQERSCIRFVPKKAHDEDYVLMKRGPGCAAHVGRIGGQQWVILGDGCFGIETVTVSFIFRSNQMFSSLFVLFHYFFSTA